ncbi:hypothetical protein [Cupriavidus necator]|uniref:hypothetical protein n=1 Tax=Cupriavidus necator TaxID=106590 RepID=UPI000F4D945D|nr:hypothetical protein [Cupriavidus necator]
MTVVRKRHSARRPAPGVMQQRRPDVIVYFSRGKIAGTNLPYLDQAEMRSGYDWSFKNPGRNNDHWFRVMCDNRANFSWGGPKRETTPKLDQIIESNDQKCPAVFEDGRWVPGRALGSVTDFCGLRGVDWTGFIVGLRNRATATTALSTITFCIVRGEDVLVGAMESDPASLRENVSFVDQIVEILSTMRFQ